MFSGLINGNGPFSHGDYIATSGDASATSATLSTGLTILETAHVQIRRGGAVITGDAAVAYSAGGTLTVGSGAAVYTLTAGDVISWFAVGR